MEQLVLCLAVLAVAFQGPDVNAAERSGNHHIPSPSTAYHLCRSVSPCAAIPIIRRRAI